MKQGKKQLKIKKGRLLDGFVNPGGTANNDKSTNAPFRFFNLEDSCTRKACRYKHVLTMALFATKGAMVNTNVGKLMARRIEFVSWRLGYIHSVVFTLFRCTIFLIVAMNYALLLY